MHLTLNFYFLLWILTFVALLVLDREKYDEYQGIPLISACLLSIIWLVSPISEINLGIDGLLFGSNGILNLRGYL